MKGKHLELVAGIAIGAVLFGGGTAYAAGLLAEPSTQTFYLGDQQIQLEAYAINGHNYVKLRDVGQAVDFNVCYDPARNAAIIEPDKPYTGEDVGTGAPKPGESVDYAAQANPAIFGGELTRESYNGIRDSVLYRDAILDGVRQPRSMRQTELCGAVQSVMTAIGKCPSYEMLDLGRGEYACNPRHLPSYSEAMPHTQDFIDGLANRPQKEQVEQAVWYVADRMSYSLDSPGPGDVLAQDSVIPGRCMVYTFCLQFLCDRLDIRCVLVCNESHEWNEVYVDGRWWVVDATACDVPESVRKYITVLQRPEDMATDINVDMMPAVTAFAKEILAPGSTQS